MKILNYFLSALLLLCFSRCAEHDRPQFCHVTSIDDLEWLRAEMVANNYYEGRSVGDVLIYHAYYQSNEVIYINICCPACNTLQPEIRSCNGESLGFLGVDIDDNLLTNKKVIWRTRKGVCS